MKQAPDTKRLLEAIDLLKKERGITVYRIAKKIGYAPQSFSRIRSGGQNVPLKWIHTICETFAINKLWVFNSEAPILLPQGTEGKKHVVNPYVLLPIYDAGLSGAQKKILGDHVVDPNYFTTIPAFKECTLAYKVSGESMAPRYKTGDIVVCKKVKDKNQVLNGEPYLIITHETSLIRYIDSHRTDANKLMLRNDNPQFAAQPINKKDVLNMYQVMGKVVVN